MKQITSSQFETLVGPGSGVVLVEFGATWCAPCRALEPQLQKFAAAHPTVTVVTVDIDAEPTLAASYQVMSVPTMILFADGQIVGRLQGVMSANRITEAFATHLR